MNKPSPASPALAGLLATILAGCAAPAPVVYQGLLDLETGVSWSGRWPGPGGRPGERAGPAAQHAPGHRQRRPLPTGRAPPLGRGRGPGDRPRPGRTAGRLLATERVSPFRKRRRPNRLAGAGRGARPGRPPRAMGPPERPLDPPGLDGAGSTAAATASPHRTRHAAWWPASEQTRPARRGHRRRSSRTRHRLNKKGQERSPERGRGQPAGRVVRRNRTMLAVAVAVGIDYRARSGRRDGEEFGGHRRGPPHPCPPVPCPRPWPRAARWFRG